MFVYTRAVNSARTFTLVAEQEVGYLSIISINFLLTRSEYSLRVLPTNIRRSSVKWASGNKVVVCLMHVCP